MFWSKTMQHYALSIENMYVRERQKSCNIHSQYTQLLLLITSFWCFLFHLSEVLLLKHKYFEKWCESKCLDSFSGMIFEKDIRKKTNTYTLRMCSIFKIENNLSWVNFTHFWEKMHLLAFELIFISSSWRVYMYIKFNT